VVIVWLAAAPALAARADLDLDVKSMEVGQTQQLRVTVVDGTPTAVPRVLVPDGFDLAYRGQLSNSGFTIDAHNKRVSVRYVVYQFDLTATREGSFSVGPATIELGADEVTTPAVDLAVIPPAPEQKTALRAEAGFDTDSAWEGQVLVYHYRLEAREEVVQSQWTLPQWDGMVAPRDGDRPRQEYALQDADGTQISVDETLVPLVATGTGRHDIEGAVVRVAVPSGNPANRPWNPFGGVFSGSVVQTRREVLATAPSTVAIKPLPAPPAAFSGLVGDFTLSGALAASTVPVGGSVVWTVTIRGNGTLEGLALPPVVVDGARVYDDSPLTDATVTDGAYVSEAKVKRAIVPTKSGELAVPPIELVVFSPTKGDYETLELAAPPIHVTPGGATASEITSFAEADPEATVIAPEDIGPIRARGFDHAVPLGPIVPYGLGALVVPFLIAFGRDARDRWDERARRRQPLAPQLTARSRLDHLPASAPAAERLALLDDVLRDALDRATDRAPLLALQAELQRARFANAPVSPDLEARVRAAEAACPPRRAR
jgi:hypothetical protein